MSKKFLLLLAVAVGNFSLLLIMWPARTAPHSLANERYFKASEVGTAPLRRKDIAVVTMLGSTPRSGHNSYTSYEQLASLTLKSLMDYCVKWGYPFFFNHDFLMDASKQAYWSKIRIMKHYLDLGYKFILYIDIDVLIIDHDFTLERLIKPHAHIIGVDECVKRNLTNSLIRSGFLFLRNSEQTRVFLLDWEDTFAGFKAYENPEQSSLEKLVTEPEHKDHVYLHSWKTVHAYDTCESAENSFSLHFPGLHKVRRVARWFLFLDKYKPCPHGHVFDLAHTFGHENGTLGLARTFLQEREKTDSLQFSDPSVQRVKKCLATTKKEGYYVSDYAAPRHSHVVRYNDVFYFQPIPKVVHITLPNKTNIPDKVANRIATWKKAGFTMVLHDDRDMKALVQDFLPQIFEQWDQLQAVLRADIWRYLVINVHGGWYADSDVELVKPLDEWNYNKMKTLVVGVEAQNVKTQQRHDGIRPIFFSQYVFGAAADHPALVWILERVLQSKGELARMSSTMTSPETRLHFVLNTTGPAAWTDVIAETICYSDTYPADLASPVSSPSMFFAGGSLVNTHVFDIGAFGSGQAHSNSPPREASHAYIWHHFGGSKLFWGKAWPSLAGSSNPKPPLIKEDLLVDANACRIAFAAWHHDLVSPLTAVAAELKMLGCSVFGVGLSQTLGEEELFNKISKASAVIWWKPFAPPSMEQMLKLKAMLPKQKWIVYNWDEPHETLVFHSTQQRMELWDAAVISGEAVGRQYSQRNVKDVTFFPFPVDPSIFFHDLDSTIEDQCDIYMNLERWTVAFESHPPFVDGVLLAHRLCEERSLKVIVDGPPDISSKVGRCYGAEHNDQRARKMFSSCKLVINIQPHDGFGGRFLARRTNEILHCHGKLLLDPSPGVIALGLTDVATIRSNSLSEVIQQARELLVAGKPRASPTFTVKALAEKIGSLIQ